MARHAVAARADLEVLERRRRRAAVLRVPEVQQAAALAHMAADESLGDETPEWIREIAERPLPPRGR